MSDSVKYLQLNKNKWDLKHFFLKKKKKEIAKSWINGILKYLNATVDIVV